MIDTLTNLPSDWWWSVDKLPRTQRLKVKKGNKRVELPYQAYVCNGALIGTKKFASAVADGADIQEALEKAVAILREKIEEMERSDG
jgi:hypothetical protein